MNVDDLEDYTARGEEALELTAEGVESLKEPPENYEPLRLPELRLEKMHYCPDSLRLRIWPSD
jgi:hypothetical protein